MILLPDEEEILDVVCGDKDFWVISATQNIAHVKPAKEGAATNLNLVTASGTVYSFLLTENKSAQPDLKIYVRPTRRRRGTGRSTYSATQLTALQNELDEARAAVEAARHRTRGGRRHLQTAISGRVAVRVRHAQVREAVLRPFDLARRAVHLYQVGRPGAAGPVRGEGRQPSLVNFQVQSGTYVVPKVLERGLSRARQAPLRVPTRTVGYGRR